MQGSPPAGEQPNPAEVRLQGESQESLSRRGEEGMGLGVTPQDLGQV